MNHRPWSGQFHTHLLKIKLKLSDGKSLPNESPSSHLILGTKQNKTHSSPYAKRTAEVTKEVNSTNLSQNSYFKDEKPLLSINQNT